MSQLPPSGQPLPPGPQSPAHPGIFGSPPPPRPSGGGNVLTWVLLGCGLSLLVILVSCGGFAYFTYQGVQKITAEISSGTSDVLIAGAQGISLDERARMAEQLQRVKYAYKSGKISMEDATATLEGISTSNVMKAVMANSMMQSLATRPELSEEEIKDVQRTRMRIARAVLDGKLEPRVIPEAFIEVSEASEASEEPAAEEGAESETAPTASVNEGSESEDEDLGIPIEQVRATVKKLDVVADEAGVGEEESQFLFDYGDEMKKFVDGKLGSQGN